MKKLHRKSLALTTETIRLITGADLSTVAAGAVVVSAAAYKALSCAAVKSACIPKPEI